MVLVTGADDGAAGEPRRLQAWLISAAALASGFGRSASKNRGMSSPTREAGGSPAFSVVSFAVDPSGLITTSQNAIWIYELFAPQR